MNDWKEYKIEDIAEVQTGPFGSQLHMKDYASTGTPIITVEHLGENKVIHENLPLVTDADKARLKKYTLAEGDIVFSRVGSVDRRAYISKKEDGWMFSGRLLRVRCNKDLVSPKFLSYYFGQESFKEYIRQIAVGATMPSINTTILSEVKLSIPSLTKQTIIADYLSVLDNKIDLLTRQNKTLEQLAETYFRQWFVEEEDEDLEQVHLLSEFINTVSDTYKSKNGTAIFLNTSDVYEGDILHSDYTEVSTLPGQAKKSIRKGDILYSEIRPANRRYGYVHVEGDDYVVSTKFMVLRAKASLPSSAIYFFLTLPQTLEWLQMIAESRSGTFPQITFTQLGEMKIRLPKGEILKRDIDLAEMALNKILPNKKQIKLLQTLRETILPKLMSGEITLNGL